MRAYQVGPSWGLEHLRLVPRPDAAPGPGQVRLRLSAVSLNYRDLLVVTGQYDSRLPLPLVPVSDGAGTIEAVGPDVTGWSVGDRVVSAFMPGWLDGAISEAAVRSSLGAAEPGLLAERAVLPAAGLVAIPPHLTFEEAACLPCAGVTAWNALFAAGGLRPGQTVLLLGTGGVSVFALQLARAAGARILVTSSSGEKLHRAVQLGAEHTINYRSEPDWDKAVRRLTDGLGVDHVLEVGGSGTLAKSLRSARIGGHVAVIGVLAGAEATVPPLPIMMRALRLSGIYVGSRRMLEDLCVAVTAHKIRPVVDRVFGFEEAPAALSYLQSARHFGKVVVSVEPGNSLA